MTTRRDQLVAVIVAELERQANENQHPSDLYLHNADDTYQGVDGYLDKPALADALVAGLKAAGFAIVPRVLSEAALESEGVWAEGLAENPQGVWREAIEYFEKGGL